MQPLIVIVGGRLVVDAWPPVVMTGTLIESLHAFPTALDPAQAAAVYEFAWRSTTWNPAVEK